MKNLLLVILCIQTSFSFLHAQTDYPCLKGNCEDGFGMKKLNKNSTYVGYHKGGKRHGLAVSFNDKKSSGLTFLNSDNGITDGMVVSFIVNENGLEHIDIFQAFEGSPLYPCIRLNNVGDGLEYLGSKNGSKFVPLRLASKGFSLMIYEPIDSWMEIKYLESDGLVGDIISDEGLGRTHIVNKLGANWSLDITTDPYMDRVTAKTTFHWDEDSFEIRNEELGQYININHVTAFPEYLGNSEFTNDMGFSTMFKIFMNQD